MSEPSSKNPSPGSSAGKLGSLPTSSKPGRGESMVINGINGKGGKKS